MVRSYWMGPLFGVLAVTGLARSETPVPAAPTKASDSNERFVTVGDLGKPGQKCRVLKTWTTPSGHPAYQVQALDTDELMTIEESESAAMKTPGAVFRPKAMRIFHWGRDAQTAPHGSPEPPIGAVVLAQPFESHSKTTEPPFAAAAPEKAPGKWPSAFVVKKSDNAAPQSPQKPLEPAAPPVVKHVDLTPLRPTPAAPKPTPVAVAPVVPSPSPYHAEVTETPVVKSTEAKPVNSKSWSAATTWKPTATTQAPAKTSEPVTVKAAPKAEPKVETTLAQPGDWRESWGKIPAPKPAPFRIEERATTKAAPKTELPHTEGRVTTKPTPKVALPHAQVKADDPLITPEKFSPLPIASDAGAFGKAQSKETKKPFLALFAANPPPAAKVEDKKPERPASTIPPPPPVPVTQAAAAAPAEITPPTTVKIPPPAPAQLVPPTADKAPAPVAAEVKPEAKPAIPLGMQSVLAAQSPELAPPAKKAKPAGVSQAQAMGIDANEANAFTEPPAGGKTAVASNGFWTPKKPAPGVNTPSESMARRDLPPAPIALPPMPPVLALPVAQAAYRPEVSPELSQLSLVLHESLYPSQREWAADRLASFDWRRQPQALELLMERAKQDPAPTVRAECVRSLGRMKSAAPEVVETLKSCRSDADASVRQEADDALAKLSRE